MYSDWLLPTICILPTTFFVAVVLLIANRAKTGRLSYAWLLLPIGLGIIFTIVLFFMVVYDSSGLVRFLCTLSLLFASTISWIVTSQQDKKTIRELGQKVTTLYYIGSFLTVISSGIAVLGSAAIISQCETYHLQIGNTIITSLEDYFLDHNDYPESLVELIPKYIKQNSIQTCYNLRMTSDPEMSEFYYKKCSPKNPQLSIPVMGTGHFHVYDFINQKWYTSNGDWEGEWSRVTACP